MIYTASVAPYWGSPVRTGAPTQQPVTLDQFREHARVVGTAEDLLMWDYLRAAVTAVENYTGLGLMLQTWRQTFSAFAAEMWLGRRPLLEVGSPAAAVSVTYRDSDGAIQTLDPTTYEVAGIGNDRWPGACVRSAYGSSWPSLYTAREAVTVSYTVGYGTTPEAVPLPLRLAVMQTATTFYELRSAANLPEEVREMLNEWRAPAVA